MAVRIAVAIAVVLTAGCYGRKNELPCTVLIVSEPEGAKVEFSGNDVGTTPVTIENVAPGQYFVQVEKPGYETWTQLVKLEPEVSQTVRVVLTRETALAVVKSSPPQARFYHEDGTLLGVTPFHGRIPTGQYRMRFSKDNYVDEFVDVKVDPHSTAHVLATLRPLRARITVTTDPSRAAIFIDEIERGYKTPATLEIEPGLRTIGVALPGYSREERDIQIEPNSTVTVHFDLVPGNVPAGMVKVPEGEFIMGCNTESADEKPRRKVYLNTFFIDKYEVTNLRYSRFKPTHTYAPELANHPVVNVTWHEAAEYAAWAGKRLPTEAEWEKAARGEDGRTYPWGKIFDETLCNVSERLVALLKPVGQYPEGRSPYGCYDMAGNVWEWVADEYAPYPGNTEMRDMYGQQFRVIRGGSYADSAYHARCSNRGYERPNVGRPNIGFRCAMSPAEEDAEPQ